jgi:hypothetical protein
VRRARFSRRRTIEPIDSYLTFRYHPFFNRQDMTVQGLKRFASASGF